MVDGKTKDSSSSFYFAKDKATWASSSLKTGLTIFSLIFQFPFLFWVYNKMFSSEVVIKHPFQMVSPLKSVFLNMFTIPYLFL